MLPPGPASAPSRRRITRGCLAHGFSFANAQEGPRTLTEAFHWPVKDLEELCGISPSRISNDGNPQANEFSNISYTQQYANGAQLERWDRLVAVANQQIRYDNFFAGLNCFGYGLELVFEGVKTVQACVSGLY